MKSFFRKLRVGQTWEQKSGFRHVKAEILEIKSGYVKFRETYVEHPQHPILIGSQHIEVENILDFKLFWNLVSQPDERV
jgi:hypothetical protein